MYGGIRSYFDAIDLTRRSPGEPDTISKVHFFYLVWLTGLFRFSKDNAVGWVPRDLDYKSTLGNKPLAEPMLMQVYVAIWARLQWVNILGFRYHICRYKYDIFCSVCCLKPLMLSIQVSFEGDTEHIVERLPSIWPAHRAGLLRSNLFGQPGSVYKFPPFLWIKLWVGGWGGDIQKLADIFPHRGLIGLLSSQRKNFCIHWDFRSHLNHQKCVYGMLFLRLKAWFYVQYTIPPAAMLGLLSLADYLC